ncbi:hypothetical protein Plhal304r1_c014g0053391 [Plasmopara halstedii]
MSHGTMLDVVKDEDKPRKHHSGPRKRRSKKKSNTCTINASIENEFRSDSCNSPLNDAKNLCVATVPFTPLQDSSIHAQSFTSPSLRSEDNNILSSPQCSKKTTNAAMSKLFHHRELSLEEREVIRGEQEQQAAERAYWTQWVIEAAEKERARRLNVLKQLQCEEEAEIRRRRQWAIATIEKEQEAMMREMFLDNMKNTQWFQSTISRFSEDYEVVCPNSWFGCTFSCMLKDLESHLKRCVYRQVPDTLDQVVEDNVTDFYSYDVVCPNAVLGCGEICSRENLAEHLAACPVNGMSREKEWEERLEWRRSVIQATEKERERRIDEERAEGTRKSALSLGNLQRLYEEQTAMMQVVLHDEIEDFCAHHEREAQEKRPSIQKAINMVTEEIQLLWNDCVQVEQYGSFATKLHGEASDVDLVVFGATQEFHFSSQQCVEVLAEHLRELSGFVDVSAISRASVPLLKVVTLISSDGQDKTDRSTDTKLRIPFDITFDEPHGIHHNGVASVRLIQGLANAFYGLRELALVLKHFLAERELNDPYVGGLSSYGLLLMVVYVLQEQGALISMVDEQKISRQSYNEDDFCELKVEVPTRWNARYDAQCLKGESIAKEIIQQCTAKQPKKAKELDKKRIKKAKRVVLPSFVTGSEDEGGHEAKPFLLGKLLMDFLQFYGNDFRQNLDHISVVSWGEPTMSFDPSRAKTFSSHSLSPPTMHLSPSVSCAGSKSPSMLVPPLSRDGLLVIEDPLQPHNNVGKSCYRVSQVFREFSDFLSFVTALIVRGSVMTTGKKKKGDSKACTTSPHSPSSTIEPTCRILKSVFQMKTREKRASLDISST